MNNIDNILWQVKFLKNSNWLGARNLLRDGIRDYPDDENLKFALAELYQSKQLFRKAIAEYQNLLPFTEQKNLVNFRIANCFLSLAEYRMALNYYNLLLEDTPEMLYNKAFTLSKLNRINEAIEVMEKIFSFNYTVNSELPNILLAELYYTLREFDKALYYLDLAQKNFGKRSSIFYLRGLIYINQQNWLKAYIEFGDAAKLQLQTPHFYKNFGLVCEKIGKTSQAIELFLKSIQISPTDPGGYIELLKIYLTEDRIMEAYSLAQHAKRNIPYSITLSMLYDQILQKINQDLIL
ncbi:MAG TPA: hypothetical protein PLD62_02785 [Candidatus Cloacimonadota bacterium]|nr:hypothetical protein [Candidatus Cloacimonadota bacterium]